MTSALGCLPSPVPETCSVLQVPTGADQGARHAVSGSAVAFLCAQRACMCAEDSLIAWFRRHDGCLVQVRSKYSCTRLFVRRVDAAEVQCAYRSLRMRNPLMLAEGQRLMLLQCTYEQTSPLYFYTLGVFRTTLGPACATRTTECSVHFPASCLLAISPDTSESRTS
jgi:hypothetical protein